MWLSPRTRSVQRTRPPLEHEAPVRTSSRRFERSPLVLRQRKRGAIVDRRQPARRLAPPAAIQFVGAFITRIKAPELFELRRRFVIKSEAIRLAKDTIRRNTEPREINLDGIGIFARRARDVGVVEAKQKGAVGLPRKQGIEESRSRIADMDAPRGRRGKADGRRWHCEWTLRSSRDASICRWASDAALSHDPRRVG